MMRKSITLLLLFFAIALCAQQTDYKFRIYLKDKGTIDYSIENPEAFLSPKSIARKQRQGIKIEASDFPISPEYTLQMQKMGGRVTAKSKWFKTLVVEFLDSTLIEHVKRLSFVDSVKYIWRGKEPQQTHFIRPRIAEYDCKYDIKAPNYLGITEKEFEVHRANRLAEAGFQGAGITIAVIDAGFTNFDVIPWFENVCLAGYQNFIPSGDIFASGSHGTHVLSTMTVNQPYKMMGSAPESSYWLLRSEEVRSEFPVEEDYWVAAVEFADSVGVDLINTSLGYNDFNDKSLDYTYADMNGKKSLMSRAADKAYDKGMLLIGSAGNEGNKKWQKITAPGDAKNMLTVGAIAIDSTIASFSSRGPTADLRLKPELVSVGVFKISLGVNGLIVPINGTSLSSPFLTGLFASLWSINPALNREKLVEIVTQSADRYQHPDTIYGYGIPNFEKAMHAVLQTLPIHEESYQDNNIRITLDSIGTYQAEILTPLFSPEAYSMKVLDKNGISIFDTTFQSKSKQIPLKKNHNNRFYIVLKSPEKQHTICIKP